MKRKLFLVPSLLGVFVLFIIPFIIGLKFPFTSSFYDNTFVGLYHVNRFAGSEAFAVALRNTVIFTMLFIPVSILLSFALAHMVHHRKNSIYYSVAFVLPYALPSTVALGFFRDLFDSGHFGHIPNLLLVGVVFLWHYTGITYLIYIIGFRHMDNEVVEAAMIDGASSVSRIRFIEIPLLKPYHYFVLIIALINSLKVFKDTFVLFGEYPPLDLFMLQNYIYLKLQELNYPFMMLAAYLFLAVIIIGAVFLLRANRKLSEELGEEI